MKAMVVENYTGDWNLDYLESRVLELTPQTDIPSLNICAVSVFSKKSGDTEDMLFSALERVKSLYPDMTSMGDRAGIEQH